MLPQFVFIGPTKTGTTWVDDYLRARGDVALPALTKETYFFDKLHHRGLAWYEAQFPREALGGGPCVEIAPSLFHKPEAAARLARDLPGAIVVATLRDPVERAVSHYFHYLKAGDPPASFAEMAARRPDLLEPGFYARHLSRWRELLGHDRVRTLSYARMTRDPDGFAAELSVLLGLPPVPPADVLRETASNVASVPPAPGLARIVRRGADWLRRAGAHRVVNALRSPALMRAVYGAPAGRERRDAVRREAEAFRSLFAEDQARLAASPGSGAAAG